MSLWHMLNICLIYVKNNLKKPWQPTVVFGYKKIILELFSLAGGQSGIAVADTLKLLAKTPWLSIFRQKNK